MNSKTKVEIICLLHGSFSQSPGGHIYGRKDCRLCANIRSSKLQRKSQEQFIKDAEAIHGVKYDYSKTIYVNDRGKIIIICMTHSEFT